MVRYHIIVYGYVQAVGFRYYTLQYAKKFDIAGWVRNREDGAVEIDAQGSESGMEAFIRAVKTGSPYSGVERVSIARIPEPAGYRGFDIRY